MSELGHEHLEQLRRDFDLSFSRPASREEQLFVPVLRIALGDRELALRAEGLRGIRYGRRIIPVRGGLPELLGLGGLQGEVIPVYDLAQLLGYGRGSRRWAWWCLPRAEEPLAFAFERLVGYAALPQQDFKGDHVETEGRLVPVVDPLGWARRVLERARPVLTSSQPQEVP